MARTLPYWLMFLVPAVVAAGVARGGPWTWSGLVFVFVLVPLLEPVAGLRVDNEGTQSTARKWAYDLPLWAWIPVQLGLQLFVLQRIVAGDLSGGFAAVAVISVGVVAAGGGIVIAHELMHRSSRAERGAAELLMASVSYTHFCIEHVHGHHRHVATPLDPASSRFGESVYRFLPRVLWRSLVSATRIELARTRKRNIAWWSLRHRVTRYALAQVLLYAFLAAWLGPVAALVWAGQAATAIVLLEAINYVEHYGLARRELQPGRYERVQPWHSWNASHRLTNWLLYNLQRHSDHHFMASRPYHALRHYDEVPQLPAGYATMVLLAFVPPLWRRLMDPKVEAWNSQESSAHAQAL